MCVRAHVRPGSSVVNAMRYACVVSGTQSGYARAWHKGGEGTCCGSRGGGDAGTDQVLAAAWAAPVPHKYIAAQRSTAQRGPRRILNAAAGGRRPQLLGCALPGLAGAARAVCAKLPPLASEAMVACQQS